MTQGRLTASLRLVGMACVVSALALAMEQLDPTSFAVIRPVTVGGSVDYQPGDVTLMEALTRHESRSHAR